MQRDVAKLKKYLLGMLPDTETEELDLRVMSDEAFSDELRLAEHDLVEDHLEGGLSKQESTLFKSAFLTSPERRNLLRETSLLKNFAKKNASAEKEMGEKASEGRGTFFALYFRPLLAAAAAAAMIFSILWFSFSGSSRSPLEKEYAELNNQDLSDISQLTEYSSIELVPGTFRGSGSAPKKPAHGLTETVLFRLALPANISGDADFSAAIHGERTSDFELEKIRAYRGPHGSELRVLVPKSILQSGQFQINVTSGTSDVGNYTFVVE